MKAAGGAGAVLLTPSFVPSSVLGKDGAVAPSERIVLGALGIGGRGTGDLHCFMANPDVQFVAICDIRKASVRRES